MEPLLLIFGTAVGVVAAVFVVRMLDREQTPRCGVEADAPQRDGLAVEFRDVRRSQGEARARRNGNGFHGTSGRRELSTTGR